MSDYPAKAKTHYITRPSLPVVKLACLFTLIITNTLAFAGSAPLQPFPPYPSENEECHNASNNNRRILNQWLEGEKEKVDRMYTPGTVEWSRLWGIYVSKPQNVASEWIEEQRHKCLDTVRTRKSRMEDLARLAKERDLQKFLDEKLQMEQQQRAIEDRRRALDATARQQQFQYEQARRQIEESQRRQQTEAQRRTYEKSQRNAAAVSLLQQGIMGMMRQSEERERRRQQEEELEERRRALEENRRQEMEVMRRRQEEHESQRRVLEERRRQDELTMRQLQEEENLRRQQLELELRQQEEAKRREEEAHRIAVEQDRIRDTRMRQNLDNPFDETASKDTVGNENPFNEPIAALSSTIQPIKVASANPFDESATSDNLLHATRDTQPDSISSSKTEESDPSPVQSAKCQGEITTWQNEMNSGVIAQQTICAMHNYVATMKSQGATIYRRCPGIDPDGKQAEALDLSASQARDEANKICDSHGLSLK